MNKSSAGATQLLIIGNGTLKTNMVAINGYLFHRCRSSRLGYVSLGYNYRSCPDYSRMRRYR